MAPKIILLLIAISPISSDIHKASWYGEKFHGRLTASGDVYDMNELTCAATNDYEFGDRLRVTNIKNGKSVVVTVNDRGNFERLGRTLDLSKGAFDEIANLDKGVIDVKIERLNTYDKGQRWQQLNFRIMFNLFQQNNKLEVKP